MRRALLAILLVAACGGDDDAPPPVKPGGAAAGGAAAAAAAAKDDKTKLVPRRRVEDRVSCPTPDPSDKQRYKEFKDQVAKDDQAYKSRYGAACTPDGAPCDHGYCLMFENVNSCIRCGERDRIRHEFVDRDFLPDSNRDPFQSFTILQPGLGPTQGPTEPVERTQDCKGDQLVASTFSYSDLRLVGIVAQGTVKKALMMDSANYGHIVKRGDCVGKEKALVVDIAAGNNPYVKFVVHPEQANRPDQEKSVELHPGGLTNLPPTYNQELNPAPAAPIVTPKSERVDKNGAQSVPPPTAPPPAAPVVTPTDPPEPPEHPRR